MGFWAGLARGYKDASEAKAQKEELEAKRAERREDFEYKRGRDTLLDERYLADKAENLRRFELNYKTAADSLAEERAWRKSQAELAQSNIETEWKRKDEYDEKTWALTLDKWNFTKDQAKEASEHADKVFNQTIAAFEYGKEQDVLTNLRRDRAETRELANTLYQKERDLVGDQRAKDNREDRLKQFEFQVKRAGVSDEQWQASFDMKKDEIELSRTQQLLSLIPSGLSSAFAGGEGKVTSMSPEAQVEGSKLFNAEFKNLSDEAKDSTFFKAAGQSPATQATLMAFIESQAKEGNTVSLEELPKYFKYVGSLEGKGEAEAKETIEALMSGEVDVNDKDAFIKGMMNLKNYRPTQELFMQTGKPSDLKEIGDKMKYWESAVETDAYRSVKSLPPEDRLKVEKALIGLQRKERRTESLDILASYNFGQDAVKEHNMGDIGVIKSYYSDLPSSTVSAEVPTGKEAEVIVEGSDPELPEGLGGKIPEGVTAFESFAEVEQARRDGFSGPAVVAGKTFNITPLYPDNEPAGMGTEPVISDEDAMEAELLAMSKFNEEPSGLRGEGPVEKYFGQQAGGLRGTGNSDEQAEGNRPGERKIDLDKFVDRSFKGEGTIEEPMNLAGAPSSVVSNKIVDLMDDVPPRTPRKNIKEWMIKEFRGRYENANIDDAKLEAMIDQLIQFVPTDEG